MIIRWLQTTTASTYFVITLAFLALTRGLTSVPLGGQLSETILEYTINTEDVRAEGLDTLTILYSVPRDAWVSIGFTDGNGLMIGSEAVVGLPDSGEVKKYSLASYDDPGVAPMPDEKQTLIDTSIIQEKGITMMKFTKILNETGEIPIAIGSNTFIGAIGFDNTLFFHDKRDSFEIDLVAGDIEVVETRNRVLWKLHGWCAALAWGLISPVAIGAAILRKWFPNGLWLKIHQYLNYTVMALTVMAFVFAVVAIQTETPAGGDPNHFHSNPNPHRLIGLILFLVVLFQIIGGQFRPHNPSEGEVKSCSRRSWEVVHRGLGIIVLAIAWYQIESGIQIYQNLFADSAGTNLSAIFWGLVGTVSGLIFVGFVVTKLTEKNDKIEPNETKDSDLEENGDRSSRIKI